MNITIACTHCDKQYTVPETVIGKRVKCKVCGEVFVAPKPSESDQGPDLAALETLEPALVTPPPIAAPPHPAREPALPAISGGFFIDGPIPRPPPIPKTRRGRRVGLADDLINGKSLMALIVVGLVLPILLAVIPVLVLVVRTGEGASILFEILLLIGGFVCIVIPLMVVGLRIAAHIMDFELVESPGFRIVAAYSGASIVAVVYVMIFPPPVALHQPAGILLTSDITWLLVAWFVSTSITLWLIKLFFFLRFGQALVAWLISSASALIGSLITISLTTLILWLGSQMFSTGSSSASNGAPASGNSPAPAVVPVSHDQDKGKASQDNLAKISLYMQQYFAANGKYPDALEALVTNENMPADVLHSPFGNGTGDDYTYAPYPVPGAKAIHDWIVVYDRAENPIENGAVILRGTGEVDFMDSNVLTFALSNGQKEAQQLLAEQKPVTSPAPVAVSTPAPIAPPPQPTSTKPSEPIEPHNTGPAWSAQVDAPLETASINAHLREVFIGNEDLYFSQNGGAWLVVNPQPTAPNASFRNPVNAELWNLRTLLREGRYPAIPPMHDVILSPAGNYLVGRTIGGDPGVAVAFEVWSARSGKRLQTLATDPITTGAVPRPIGFPFADQVLTAGDQFDVWNLKTGARIRQFADQLKMDAKTLIAPSPNCHFAAVLAGDDSGVWLVSATTGKTLGEAMIDNAPVGTGIGRAIAFSPDGQEIAALISGQWIYAWSAATGKQLARFDIDKPVSGGTDANTLIWMPDGQDWLVGGDRIIDREIGDCIYPLPAITEQGGQEFGQRRVIDVGHIVTQFRTTTGDKTALEALPIDSSFVKTRDALRADRQAMKNAPR